LATVGWRHNARALARKFQPARAKDPRPALQPSTGVEVPGARRQVGRALLLYHLPTAFWYSDASTVMDHVRAFERYSRFGVHILNTDTALPSRIAELDFQLVIVHYSVFGPGGYLLNEDHLEWVRTSRAHKVVFAQDENRYCGHRFWFLDEIGCDTIYTCLEPSEFDKVYGSRTRVSRIRTNLPGYVSEQMVEDGERLSVPDERRPIDVGYRGRQIPAYSGRGGYEKAIIGERFAELAADSGLVLDIEVGEESRLYGERWPRFLAACKGVLGVESGVSIFDLDDEVTSEYEEIAAQGREVRLEDLKSAPALEGNVYYRALSPRHFEAATLRNCQILFEGRYSGVMEPMVHYIPLRKDFSNFDEVIARFRDPALRRELATNAYRDLIASGRYSYKALIESFDQDLLAAGLEPRISQPELDLVRRALRHGRWRREGRSQLRWTYHGYLSPRAVVHRLAKLRQRMRPSAAK
jgi:hypothetical protein